VDGRAYARGLGLAGTGSRCLLGLISLRSLYKMRVHIVCYWGGICYMALLGCHFALLLEVVSVFPVGLLSWVLVRIQDNLYLQFHSRPYHR